MNLKTARVFVKDIQEAKAFYETNLGLSVKADGTRHGYFVLDAGNTELVVESVLSDAPKEEQALLARFTGLSFSVEDISQTFEKLSGSGVEFTGEPERQMWGGILATFRDPSGNELQIVQHPAA